MSKSDRPIEALTDEQRRLVADNLGLIAVHLRRHVGHLMQPNRDREWDDLFQEGCLGLIQAATAFQPERGIPFVAFAFPRIHNAVSRALRTRFSLIHVPARRVAKTEDADASERDAVAVSRPRVVSIGDDAAQTVRDHRRHRPLSPDVETVGDRIRGKFERAARDATDAMAGETSRRGDRARLARVLLEERVLIPNEASKAALRQIARDTKSSYARVAQAEKKLLAGVRARLAADPEFAELTRRARASGEGHDRAVDRNVEESMAALSGDTFVRRLRHADPATRSRMFDALLDCEGPALERALRDRVARLDPCRREALLRVSHAHPCDSA